MERHVKTIAWSLSVIVTAIATYAWGDFINWRFNSSYRLFPLFGLLAFSIMWSHYIAVALRIRYKPEKGNLKKYFSYTSKAVLVFILLHPGLLIWQLWRDGLGLPPKSFLENYVNPSMKGAVILGTISFFVFLSFELHRVYGRRSWWKYVQYGSDVAMVMVFIHGLRLGSLMNGWFRYVWYFYGITYLTALLYTYIQKAKLKEAKT